MDHATSVVPTGPTRLCKRVALFTGAYNHIADGVSLTLNRLVEHLLRENIEVRIVAPSIREPVLNHHGVVLVAPSVALPGRQEYRIGYRLSRFIIAELDRFGPSLVHIVTPDLLGYQALKWARRRGLPIVSTYHTHFASYLKYYRLRMAEPIAWHYLRAFYRQCDELYVLSEVMRDELQRHGIDTVLRVWSLGVDMELFNPVRRASGWRQTFGLRPDLPVISFVSRLVREKGVDVFATVVEELRARGHRFHSVVVGEGPARVALEARLPETTFTGHLTGTALAEAFASSDIFLFPSETEAFGSVVIEAMASQIPVVAADSPGSRHLVEHGVTGFLAPAGDITAFSSCTERLLLKPQLRSQYGENGRKRAQRYRWDSVLSQILRYYEQVLATAPAVKRR